MIDLTNMIITKLRQRLDITNVLSGYQPVVPSFPCITVEEQSNNVYRLTRDSSGNNHHEISYFIDIYTNGNGRISKAKSLRGQVDSIIEDEFGLIRVSANVIPNYIDTNIYRYRLVYSGVISNDKTIYGR